jgi:hypothetical protein
MKRFAAIILLLTVTCWNLESRAQEPGTAEYGRQSIANDKKSQKNSNRAAKKQMKANKKHAKAQQKAQKKAAKQEKAHPYRSSTF